MRPTMTTAFGILGLAMFAPPAGAHFKLIEPASWIEEDERGDPQKMAPCGGTLADGGTRTGVVTEVAGGSRLKIVVNETIYHPGHYRIALARRLNWLPADPIATMKDTDRGPRSASGEIEENPRPPVLVDGLWVHHEEFTGMRETEIDVPNVDCENCFLQIIQFMEDHPGFREGGFSYHHCAVVTITADPGKPPAEGW